MTFFFLYGSGFDAGHWYQLHLGDSSNLDELLSSSLSGFPCTGITLHWLTLLAFSWIALKIPATIFLFILLKRTQILRFYSSFLQEFLYLVVNCSCWDSYSSLPLEAAPVCCSLRCPSCRGNKNMKVSMVKGTQGVIKLLSWLQNDRCGVELGIKMRLCLWQDVLNLYTLPYHTRNW